MITLERINDYLTSDEAVQLLGCSKRTLRRYVSQGLVSKAGKGRGVRYSAESVMHLASSKGIGRLDRVLTQLSSIAHTQQLILARLDLMEAVFFAGSPKVTLSEQEIKAVRESAKELLKEDALEFDVCSDWSTDLLRISNESLAQVGTNLVLALVDRMIINAESSVEIIRSPRKRVVVDRLRWIKSSAESKRQV